MIHLVCDCGALVSALPMPGPRSVPCRACGKVVEVPDAAAVGLDPAGAPGAAWRAPPAPVAIPAPVAAAPHPIPAFDADERLDLRVLEREASRLRVMGVLVLAAGILGAAAAGVIPGRAPAEKALLAAACLFAATAGWAGLRAARASCLAAVALAQRQREILRGMARA